MFTFQKQDYDPIFYVDDKPVYTLFTKDDKKRIPPFRNPGTYLDSNDFLESFNLSRSEGKILKQAIRKDTVPEGLLKSKFYSIRKELNARLFTTIDLRDTKHKISWKFPQNPKQWPTTMIVIGSSGVGKTHLMVQMITEALKRRRKRKFVYVSPELNIDTTLKKLVNNKRYRNFFRGIDIGDEEFKEWQTENMEGTPEMWWEKTIKPILTSLEPGTFVVLDDSPDSVLAKFIRPWLIKMLRTGRHKSIGLSSIQHNIRGGKWTSQSFSSVKWVHLFPRGGGKGLIVEFLNEQQGLQRKKGRDYVELFGEEGRWMTIHQWSPPVLFGPKYATFL